LKTAAYWLALTFAPIVWAGSPCTTRQIEGTYAFLANGSVLVPGAPLTGPFMRIGYFTADGRGGLVFTTLAIYNGINFGSEHFTGTYSVASDCAIDLNVALPAPILGNVEFKGWVGENGNDVTFMLVDAATVPPLSTVVGFGKQRDIERCSTGDLRGRWTLELNGSRNLAPGVPGTPWRQLAQLEDDQHGRLTASIITSNGGVISQVKTVGTYAVNSDCTFDLNYSIGSSPYSVRGSLIRQGEADAALNMPAVLNQQGSIVSAGSVATGTMIRQTNAHRED
jgi:hypothetical protein